MRFFSFYSRGIYYQKFVEEIPCSTSPSCNTNSSSDSGEILEAKPVIYLYPKEPLDIYIRLQYRGNITLTYPDASQGEWKVRAFPDGRILNYRDQREYAYLFWEGTPETIPNYSNSHGFIVKREDSVSFLQSKLNFLGLSDFEANEFIVYWYPILQRRPYNWLYFADTEYTEHAGLDIIPAPDSLLRICMVVRGLDSPINIQEQVLYPFHRHGFSVIEWGGVDYI